MKAIYNKLNKNLKQKYRQVRRSIVKYLSKKKNQRRLYAILAVLAILALSYATFTLSRSQGALKRQIEHNNAVISAANKEINIIKSESANKDAIIEKNKAELKKKESSLKKEKESSKKLSEKANSLNKEITKLKSVYGGYGGGSVSVAGVSYSPGNSYAPLNCTWGVKNWKPSVPNFLGNANEWAAKARAMGVPVNSTPSVGSVAQTTVGGYGHVALTIGVNGDMVTIKEMNGAGGLGSVSVRAVHKSEFIYIHFS